VHRPSSGTIFCFISIFYFFLRKFGILHRTIELSMVYCNSIGQTLYSTEHSLSCYVLNSYSLHGYKQINKYKNTLTLTSLTYLPRHVVLRQVSQQSADYHEETPAMPAHQPLLSTVPGRPPSSLARHSSCCHCSPVDRPHCPRHTAHEGVVAEAMVVDCWIHRTA